MSKIIASTYTKLFWNEFLLNPNAFQYNMVLDQTLIGSLNIKKLENAIEKFVNFYFLFQCCLEENNQQLYWKPTNTSTGSFLTIITSEADLTTFVKQPFNLSKGPLARFGLLTKDESHHELVIVAHHVLIDGASAEEFYRSLSALYNDPSANLDLPDRAAVQAQLHHFGSEIEKVGQHHAEQFWENCLQACEATNTLPYIHSTDTNTSSDVGVIRFSIPSQEWKQRKASIRYAQHFLVFKTLWALLTARYCQSEKVHLSYPVAIDKGDRLIFGAQVNTAVFPLHIASDDSFSDLYRKTLDYTRALRAAPGVRYTQWPIFNVLRHSAARDLNVSFVQAHFQEISLNFNGCKAHYNRRFNHDIASSALVLEYQLVEEHFNFRIRYQSGLFESAQIQAMADQFLQLWHDALTYPDLPVCELPYLTVDQRQQILTDWNTIPAQIIFKPESTLHEVIQQQAAIHPNRTALIDAEVSLTYAELEARSNQMAHWITHYFHQQTGQKIAADTLIPLVLNRRVEMIVALLAIMKSGAAYVPLDPNTPPQRLHYILENCSASVVVTESGLETKIRNQCPKAHLLLTDGPDHYSAFSPTALNTAYNNRQLAYVIYTSGTTGEPKGTLLEHRGVLNTIAGMQADLFGSNDRPYRCLQFASLAFDAHVAETFIALCGGHTLIVASEAERKDLHALVTLLTTHQVEMAIIPPALLKVKLDLPSSLQRILVAGESTPLNIMEHYAGQGRQLYNGYGPTEASICVSINIYRHNGAQNIGRPLPNTHLYVLDKNLQSLPVGVIGELYVSGCSLARGYLNKPEQTRSSFIENPFSSHPEHDRLYRTGDCVRWLPDGNIEYIGRDDFQIKINGHRIELGEIEQALGTLTDIGQCAAVVPEKENPRIIAYYTAAHTLLEEDMTRALRDKLPDYMIPAAFVQVETLPLTVNGKLNTALLPVPAVSHSNTRTYRPANSLLEQRVLSAWQHVLGNEQIGIDDDFFRLGGDSIGVIRVVSELRRIGLMCGTQDIYQHRTIAELAHHLGTEDQALIHQGEQGQLTGTFDLLPVQHWFFAQNFEQDTHWNQAFLIRTPELDRDRLQASIAKLVAHHDCLRLRFQPPAGENTLPVQTYQAEIPLPELQYCRRDTLSDEALQVQLSTWQRHFDYQHGPLWRFAYIDGYADGSARIFCAFHHLVVDAVSWRILTDDLHRLYNGEELAQKGTSYREWQATLQEYGDAAAAQQPYWEAQCAAQTGYAALLFSQTNHQYQTHLTPADTTRLINLSTRDTTTQINHLLLAAFLQALSDITDKNEHTLILESHGRELPGAELDTGHTVGWFTATYPVHFSLSQLTGKENDTRAAPHDLLQHIHTRLGAVPANGLGYGALRYLTQRDNSALRLPFPCVLFNYLGRFEQQQGSWQITDEPAGKTVNNRNISTQTLLAFNAWIAAGQLCIRLDGPLTRTTLTQIGSRIQTALAALLDTVNQHDSETLRIEAEVTSTLLHTLQQQYPLEAIYPATSLQQGFIYHHISQPDDDSYRVQVALDYFTALDPACYAKAWEMAIAHYPILRTCFNWEEEPLQLICRQAALDWDYIEDPALITNDRAVVDTAIEAICSAQQTEPFDLAQPRLMRIRLVKLGQQHYCMIKTTHHSITDGWSEQRLLAYVHETYLQLLTGEHQHSAPDQAYLEALRHYQRQSDTCSAYWQDQHLEELEANDITTLLGSPTPVADTPARPVSLRRTVPANVTISLQAVARNHGLTLNVLLQFVWHKLIHIFSREPETIVGTTISGRSIPVDRIEESVGLFINTLPLVVRWNNDSSCLQQLENLQQKIAELDMHSFQTLADLQHNGEPLFHTLFVFENYPEAHHDTIPFSLRTADEHTDYPLTIAAHLNEQGLEIQLTALPHHEAPVAVLERIYELLETLLVRLPTRLHYPHHQLTALSAEEYRQVTDTWNQTERATLPFHTLHEGVERSARLTPEKIALVDNTTQLTYAELDAHSARQAALLHQVHHAQTGTPIGPDTLIGLCCDRNVDMIVALLAILKTGGAYVPMDPKAPQERLNHIVEDSGMRLAIIQDRMHPLFQQPALHCLSVETLKKEAPSLKPLPPQTVSENDLAYVIYTSGTTGKPKGTLLEHHGPVNTVHDMIRSVMPPEGTLTRGLQFSSIVFDAHVTETFIPLCAGHTLVIASDEQRVDLTALLALIEKHQVHSAFLPPALLKLKPALPVCLKHIMTGGENTPLEILEYYTGQGHLIFNGYGPTEDSVCCTTNIYRHNGARNIGRPMSNRKVYILDKHLQPVPIGAAGEICLSGYGLARGYLHQPELTAEKFIDNPFCSTHGYQRLYRTGDIARWLPNGEIEYIGRNDFQVKIDGHRIELQEIEQVINTVAGVTQSTVIVRQGQTSPLIIAYYTEAAPVDSALLQQATAAALPHYMRPDAYLRLETMPVTLSGKLDLRALPMPDLIRNTTVYAPPLSALETRCCAIWEQVLGCERIGTTDNFFKIGGNSIAAIRLCNRISQELNIPVSVNLLNTNPTVGDLCAHLENTSSHTPPARIEPAGQSKGPLSSSQLRLWFIEEFMQGSNLYHIPLLLELRPETDIAAYTDSLAAIAHRHHILRSTVHQHHDGHVTSVIHDKPLETSVVETEAAMWLTTLKKEIDRPFNLRTEYPIRSVLIERKENNGAITRFSLINVHHIAFDGWSLNVLIHELCTHYNAAVHGVPAGILPLSVQYLDYAYWQEKYFDAGRMDALNTFWLDTLKDYPQLDLPTDFPRPMEFNYDGASHHYSIDAETSQLLRQLARRLGVTPHAVIMTAVNILLSRYSEQQDIVVGGVVANRSVPETEKLIGFFVNSLVLRNHVQPELKTEEQIRQVFENTLACLQHQEMPFEKLVENLRVERDLSRHPIFQVVVTVEQKTDPFDSSMPVVMHSLSSLYEVAKFDLGFWFEDGDAAFSACINYARALFKPETIERMAAHLSMLLKDIAAAPEKTVAQLNMLSPAELERLLHPVMETRPPEEYDFCLHQGFIEHAHQYPNDTAVIDTNGRCTYGELYKIAQTLANQIMQRETVSPLIAVTIGKSRAQVAAVLAVLMSGRAYLPMDISWPAQRREAILAQTGTDLILSDTQWGTETSFTILVDALGQAQNVPLPETLHPPCIPSTDALAYVIFTSGSTGTPKGVALQHRTVSNTLVDLNERLNIGVRDVVFAINALSFDVSVYDIFGLLSVGGSLVIPSEAERYQPDTWFHLMEKHQVTVWMSTPALFELLLDYAEQQPEHINHSLRRVALGGDWVATNVPQRCLRWAPQSRFFSIGGATETSICSSIYPVEAGERFTASIPYGKPLTNQCFYILDEQLNPVPEGIAGELCTGGAGLACGYYNNPEQTAARFFYHNQIGERIYRTGDRGRFLPDGNIEFLGRLDNQIKLNGYRIELGEIENALLKFDTIRQCTILKVRTKKDTLVAYYTSDNPVDHTILQQHLGHYLPHYMIPAQFIHLQHFQLNASGKIDRKSLPSLDISEESTQTYAAPVTEQEQALCKLWQNILGTTRIGLDDDFFTQGGTSIAAISLCQRMSTLLSQPVPVIRLFKHRTIRALLADMATDNQPVQTLNHHQAGLKTLWMIHPAMAGCEVYLDLASRLEGQLNCLGVDNHNLYDPNGISSLQGIAAHYLEQITQHASFTGKTIHLLGWSLGGLIALEMAAQLEARGINAVKLHLLDTYYHPPTTADVLEMRKTLMAALGIEGEDAKRALNAAVAEEKIANGTLSTVLQQTRVTLFKATQLTTFHEVTDLDKNIEIAADNHVGEICRHLRVIPLECDHHTIIQQTEPIIRELLQASNKENTEPRHDDTEMIFDT